MRTLILALFALTVYTPYAHAENELDRQLLALPVMRAIDLIDRESPFDTVEPYRNPITFKVFGLEHVKLVIEPALVGGYDSRRGGTLLRRPRVALVWSLSKALGFGLDVRNTSFGGTECLLRLTYHFH